MVAFPTGATATIPGRDGELAFEHFSSQDENGGSFSQGIFSKLHNAPRAGMHELIGCSETGPAAACGARTFRNPSYAGDGENIAFRLGNHLALMEWDGSFVRPLPQVTSLDDEPSWAPDGERLVFVGHTPDGTPQLYTVRPNGTRPQRLGFSGAGSPSWSSRNRIAFEYRGGIYVVRPSGAGLHRVVREGAKPDWSAHGKRLAYVRRGRIYLARANGSHRRRVRLEAGRADDVAWSPSGRWLAYHVFDEGVWVSHPNGTGTHIVASGGVGDIYSFDSFSPAWQPLPRTPRPP